MARVGALGVVITFSAQVRHRGSSRLGSLPTFLAISQTCRFDSRVMDPPSVPGTLRSVG